MPEPLWFSEVKARLVASEAAALKGEEFDLDESMMMNKMIEIK